MCKWCTIIDLLSGVCSSYLMALRRYNVQLLTCYLVLFFIFITRNDVSWLSYACFLVCYSISKHQLCSSFVINTHTQTMFLQVAQKAGSNTDQCDWHWQHHQECCLLPLLWLVHCVSPQCAHRKVCKRNVNIIQIIF